VQRCDFATGGTCAGTIQSIMSALERTAQQDFHGREAIDQKRADGDIAPNMQP